MAPGEQSPIRQLVLDTNFASAVAAKGLRTLTVPDLVGELAQAVAASRSRAMSMVRHEYGIRLVRDRRFTPTEPAGCAEVVELATDLVLNRLVNRR